MQLSGPGFLWSAPVLGGLFTLVTVVMIVDDRAGAEKAGVGFIPVATCPTDWAI